jgi:hypothetical protein
MKAIYNKACALDPKERYSSAAELKNAYMEALSLRATTDSNTVVDAADTVRLKPTPTRAKGLFERIKEMVDTRKPLRVVCWIWDAYLAAIALFILLIVLLCVFLPGDVDDAKMPLLYRFIEYNGMFGFPCLALLYAISWREPIRNIWPNAKLLSRLKAVGLALACFFAVFIVLTIFRTILGY